MMNLIRCLVVIYLRRNRMIRFLAGCSVVAAALLGGYPASAQEFHPDRVIVKFKAGAPSEARAQAAERVGMQARDERPARITMLERESATQTVPELVAELEASGLVEYAEPDWKVELSQVPNDPYFPSLWGIQRIGAPKAWDQTLGDPSAVVAVVDTGVDYTHPDLAANMWRNPGEVPNGFDDDGNGWIDDIYGANCAYDSGDPFDDYGHGTHVAGTIAAAIDDHTGVVGVSPRVKIMALKFFDANGGAFISDAIECFDYARAMKARGVNIRVTNNSWGCQDRGTGGCYSQALYDAMRRLQDAGVLSVAAAANSGLDTDVYPAYPASFDLPGIISVAATDSSDQLAGFSNFGRTSVDLAAPGVDVLSSVPFGGYASYSGTSMASPHVAGAAMLFWSVDPGATPSTIKKRILESVEPLPSLQGRVATGGLLSVANVEAPSQPVSGASLKLSSVQGQSYKGTLEFASNDRALSALKRSPQSARLEIGNPNTGERHGFEFASLQGTCRSSSCTTFEGYTNGLYCRFRVNRRLDVRCAGDFGLTLDESRQGELAVAVEFGDAQGTQGFCSEFGGRVSQDYGFGSSRIPTKAAFWASGAAKPLSCSQ